MTSSPQSTAKPLPTSSPYSLPDYAGLIFELTPDDLGDPRDWHRRAVRSSRRRRSRRTWPVRILDTLVPFWAAIGNHTRPPP